MVTSLVLLDVLEALGAALGISHDPGEVLTLSARLVHPLLDDVADSRAVLLLLAQ